MPMSRGTVTELRHFRGVTSIYIDGICALRIKTRHFDKKPLSIGQEIDPEVFENAVASIQYNDAWESALTSLDFAPRTSREIKQSLLRKGYVPTVAEAVVGRLTECQLIDDLRLAERFVENSAEKPVGLYSMKNKLRAKGVSEEDIEAALSCMDDAQQQKAALKAAEKYMKKYQQLPVRTARAKLSQALSRRGFPWEVISTAVEQLFGCDETMY